MSATITDLYKQTWNLSFINKEIKHKLPITSQGSNFLQSKVNHSFSNNTVKIITTKLCVTHGSTWLRHGCYISTYP